MRELGWRRCISRFDGEHSLVTLKTAVRDAMPDVEMIPKDIPGGHHAANGAAENAVKDIKRPVRVLKRKKLTGKSCNNMFWSIIQLYPFDNLITENFPRHH